MITYYFSKLRTSFWFRIFGYGIAGKDTRVWRLLFSERLGYTKTLRISNWSFKILKPGKT